MENSKLIPQQGVGMEAELRGNLQNHLNVQEGLKSYLQGGLKMRGDWVPLIEPMSTRKTW